MYTKDNKHDILSGIPMYEISDHLPIFAIAKQIKPMLGIFIKTTI